MRLTHLGIIGAGSIATELLAVLGRCLPEPLAQITILTRPGRAETAHGLGSKAAGSVSVLDDLDAFRTARPDLVLECAGHGAVRDHVAHLLGDGIDTVAVSTGALADPDLARTMEQAARAGESQLIIPAGAVGAMDILAGLRHADVQSVTYTSRKPPGAWAGTPAEQVVDLGDLDTETTFYEGTARAAARDYPKNANVAATIALCGVGFENTRVQLVADPGVQANIHAFEVISDAAEVSVRIEGKPSPANPKTSLPTVYSLVREVMRRVEPVVT